MDQLIQKANAAIDRVLKEYRRPAFMCSFGKDSMVLLHLLRSRDINLPVIFHRDPWFPEKYEFADRIIRECGLEVYDWAPAKVTMWSGEAIMAFTNYYQIGYTQNSHLGVPKNILKPEPGKKFICGLKDVLRRPTGGFNYPWDVILIGHKSSDEDQIAGKIPLNCDIKQNAGIAPDAAFPLKEWTDKDIWDYTEQYGVPQQETRYQNRAEVKDKTANSDYAHVCIACIDRHEKAPSVHCPKLGCMVSNVSALVPYQDVKMDYFGEGK